MKIAGSASLPFPPEKAYDLMQDPAVLAKAIPGCDSLEKTAENQYRLQLRMALASLSGAFEGQVKLTDPNRPSSFRMEVDGAGKIGFIKAEGTLRLTPGESGTTDIAFDGDAQIGGRMAAVGQRLLDTTARMLIKRFFDKLAAEA